VVADGSVLVVDDDDAIRETLVDFLDENGYSAVGAIHGRDALEKLDGSGRRPCLILLDLMMPVMDGISFREQQLKTPGLEKIPTIIMSAHADVRAVAGQLDAVAYLKKPLNVDQLLGFMNQICAHKA
jgi:CheY-like chemotaxis protein